MRKNEILSALAYLEKKNIDVANELNNRGFRIVPPQLSEAISDSAYKRPREQEIKREAENVINGWLDDMREKVKASLVAEVLKNSIEMDVANAKVVLPPDGVVFVIKDDRILCTYDMKSGHVSVR